ncbi:shootin-1 [Parasteatoda tepidariorum]|uniref:shootin-1 n=1 Tax=Parasteatoda tepidariorum TaxID=114398 RepID=UPI001C71D193|nr:shootin-1 [Parasteatoda tepidariorum]XP_015919808.2 shootin-1 [Parasteatoda tepidariorum]
MEKKSFKNKTFSRQNDSCKEKLELLEEKFQKMKEILKQVLKDLKNEKTQTEILQAECTKLAAEVREKDELLERMHSVSEAVVDEFSALKVKCDMETEAANMAIKRATRYFQENQMLRSNPACETSFTVENKMNGTSDCDGCENESELEILNDFNSSLRTEIAELKTKLNKEIEKQTFLKEDFEIAKKLYEQEMREHKCTTEKLKSLEVLYDSVVRAIDSQITSDDSSLEKNLYQISCNTEICDGNNQNSKDENSVTRDVAATLTIIEKQKNVLRSRIRELERQILNIKLNVPVDQSLSIPPPPPPPPPPSFNPIKSLITFINASKKPSRKISVPCQEGVDNEHQKAMNEMINAIKKGNIHLKPVPKIQSKTEANSSEPVALVEMKNILQTLKKRNCDLKAQTETKFSTEEILEKESCSFSNGDNNVPCIPNPYQEHSNTVNSDSDDSYSKEMENYSKDDNSSLPIISPSFCDSNGNEFKYTEVSPCSTNVDDDDKDDCVMII